MPPLSSTGCAIALIGKTLAITDFNSQQLMRNHNAEYRQA